MLEQNCTFKLTFSSFKGRLPPLRPVLEGLEVTDDSEDGRGESRDRSDECIQSSTQRLSSCLGRQENDTTGGANPAWC